MSLVKKLTQKIRHPKTNGWIDLMYLSGDDASDDSPLSIYWHGGLADSNVITQKNLSKNMIGYAQLRYIDKTEEHPEYDNNEAILDITIKR